MTGPDYSYEQAALARGATRVAGVDEVGRGPLAGPVTAAAVVLDPNNIPPGMNDSKVLSAKKREALYDVILAGSTEAVIKGDAKSLSISAASIVAKICRDRIMWDLAQQFPGYGWETNAGYPSKSHREALQNLGVTPHHRRSFKPVHNILYQE
jgi:ribonuclease HII